MIRQLEGFGQTGGETLIHPIGLIAVMVLGIAMLLLPRCWAVFPMLIIACFIPSAQRIVIFGLDFSLLRIMIIFGVFRLLLKKEYYPFTWNKLDTAILLWTLSAIIIYILRQADFSAVVNRSGFGFDVFGMYFLFRCLIRSWNDIDTIIIGVILISIPISLFFILENRTGRNIFSIFGGVSEITHIRNDRLRCQGPYSHAILAGCFWAALMPLIASYWWKSAQTHILTIISLFASMVIVVCCASSTPVGGMAAAMIGGIMFLFRKKMRFIGWGVLLMLIGLHFVMKAPVWHLISRVSAAGGSTGYFRYKLIDGAITHFHEWALLGTKSTAHWFWGAQDITNHYILEGVRGGFLTLCLFVAVIVVAFRDVGQLWRQQAKNPYTLAISWALGVSLFVHCVNFIGVSYFGSIHILWYLVLAMIGSLTTFSLKPVKLKVCTATNKQQFYRHKAKLVRTP